MTLAFPLGVSVGGKIGISQQLAATSSNIVFTAMNIIRNA